jgi:hypothetical protein
MPTDFQWPTWLGTPSQVGLLVVVFLALIKVWPTLRQQNIDAWLASKQSYVERIKDLERQVKECQADSIKKDQDADKRERRLQDEIDALKTKINNEAWQRVQSEISLVSTLVAVVPNAELKIILEALQRRSALLPADVTALGKLEGDAKENEE